MRRYNFILFVGLTLFNTKVFSVQVIPLWTYYDFPPFIINAANKEGLVYDLAALMSKHSGGEYQFIAQCLPRRRLDQKLAQQHAGVVAFVSPLWFKGEYLWSKALLAGQNDVISLRRLSVEYRGPESIKGMHFTGLLGHNYPGIDELVKDGDIKRSDVLDILSAVKTLLKGRTEVILLPRVAAFYQFSKLNEQARVHYSKQPQYQFNRHVFFQPQLKTAFVAMSPLLNNLFKKADWLAKLQAYNLQSLMVIPE